MTPTSHLWHWDFTCDTETSLVTLRPHLWHWDLTCDTETSLVTLRLHLWHWDLACDTETSLVTLISHLWHWDLTCDAETSLVSCDTESSLVGCDNETSFFTQTLLVTLKHHLCNILCNSSSAMQKYELSICFSLIVYVWECSQCCFRVF